MHKSRRAELFLGEDRNSFHFARVQPLQPFFESEEQHGKNKLIRSILELDLGGDERRWYFPLVVDCDILLSHGTWSHHFSLLVDNEFVRVSVVEVGDVDWLLALQLVGNVEAHSHTVHLPIQFRSLESNLHSHIVFHQHQRLLEEGDFVPHQSRFRYRRELRSVLDARVLPGLDDQIIVVVRAVD